LSISRYFLAEEQNPLVSPPPLSLAGSARERELSSRPKSQPRNTLRDQSTSDAPDTVLSTLIYLHEDHDSFFAKTSNGLLPAAKKRDRFIGDPLRTGTVPFNPLMIGLIVDDRLQ